MSHIHWGLLFLTFIVPASVIAEGGIPFKLVNRVRVEYDDNIRSAPEGKESSFKLIEEIEIRKGLEFDNTTFNFRYSPSYTWWSDRDEDDSDLHHQLGATLSHGFSENVNLSLSHTLRFVALPELVGGDFVSTREEDDFLYNSTLGDLSVNVTEQTALAGTGRFLALDYVDDETAAAKDYDKFIFGAEVRHQLNPKTNLSLDSRIFDTSYENDTRDSDGYQVGVSVGQVLGSGFVASFRGGAEVRNFGNDAFEQEESPYGRLSFDYTVSEATRLNLGTGYSLSESALTAFAIEEQFSFSAGIAHDLTTRITWALSAYYTLSSYDLEQTDPASGVTEDGDEDFIRFSTKLSYLFRERNWLELSYNVNDLTSDLSAAREYTRNRVSLGWRTEL